MKNYLHTICVQGDGVFPLDMLRYDCLHPKHTDDATRMAASLRHLIPSEGVNIFYLEREAPKNWSPTEARWESFGFRVVSHSIR